MPASRSGFGWDAQTNATTSGLESAEGGAEPGPSSTSLRPEKKADAQHVGAGAVRTQRRPSRIIRRRTWPPERALASHPTRRKPARMGALRATELRHREEKALFPRDRATAGSKHS